MGFFPKSIHDAADEGDEAFVKDYIIKKKKNLNTFNKWNYTPLFHACANGQYNLAILLLEAGATPHCHPEDKLCLTPIHLMITYVRIRVMKLLIWFDPNYENVLEPLNKTVKQRISIWPQSAQNLLKATAVDAKTVIAYRKVAETLEETGDYLEAGLKYAAIAEVFYRHSQAEKTYKFELDAFVMYSGFNIEAVKENDRKAQQTFAEYYLVQTEKYLCKFIECISQLSPRNQSSEAVIEHKATYQTVLDELISISKGDFKRKADYLNKLAHLLAEPDSHSEHTSSEETAEPLELSAKDDAKKPLLADVAGTFGLHKRNQQSPVKVSTDYSSSTSLRINRSL